MWIVEPIETFEQLSPTDQLWLIALAVEENGGPAEYVLALRELAERLEEVGWWLSEPAFGVPPKDKKHWAARGP